MSEQQEIDGHTIEISNSDKVLFPELGITKGDVIDYYRRIAPVMLPHMRGRPLTMQRFPDGIDSYGFYEKEAPDYFPSWIQRVSIFVEGEGKEQEQITCEDEATLTYLANQACLTHHIWLSRADSLRHPDKLIFDLDPPSVEFEPVRQAAYDLRDLLEEVALTSHVMTTGSRGLHVVVALDGNTGYDAVRNFARDLAEVLACRFPERLTIEQRKAKRGGRLFLDTMRNAYGQNSVAPYALRARPGAPVAAPLDWSELDDGELTAQSYSIQNIFRRMGQKEDPWRKFGQHAHALEKAQRKLSDRQE
jgi:bifunctional non-homologous end joining protein LigD